MASSFTEDDSAAKVHHAGEEPPPPTVAQKILNNLPAAGGITGAVIGAVAGQLAAPGPLGAIAGAAVGAGALGTAGGVLPPQNIRMGSEPYVVHEVSEMATSVPGAGDPHGGGDTGKPA